MKLINLADMLAVAKENHFGVGSFNAIDSHFVDSIFSAAEQSNSPFILSFAEVHSRHVELEDIANHVHYRMNKTNVPVTLNLDHGVTLDMVERAINSGFTSVMFDGSHLAYEENVRQTAEVVKMCRNKNISVEGELGSVGGDEGGALEGSADESFFTDINWI